MTGKIFVTFWKGDIACTGYQRAGYHPHVWQLRGQHFGSRFQFDPQHNHGIEVAAHLLGLGFGTDFGLHIRPGLSIGGNLVACAAGLVEHGDEFVADQFVELVGMDGDHALLGRAGLAVAVAVLVNLPG